MKRHSALVLDGNELSTRILQQDLVPRAEMLRQQGITPHLAVLSVGNNPASRVYVQRKAAWGERVGISVTLHHFEEHVGQEEVIQKIEALNADSSVHGMIVQLPLPGTLDKNAIVRCIAPHKDADGLTPENMGRLTLGQKGLRPCTPKGVLRMLREYNIEIAGKRAVVVGRSGIVGRPLSLMLTNANATVTMAHSHTPDLNVVCKSADLLFCATGIPKMFHESYMGDGAVVIDIGQARNDDGVLVGDIENSAAERIASAYAPSPGGVGPMTVVSLLENVLDAAERKFEYK